MTYSEILSAAQSLSEAERQSLVQALSSENQLKREFLQARGCQPCWKSRGAALIAATAVTTVSARTTARNASSAVYAGCTPSTGGICLPGNAFQQWR